MPPPRTLLWYFRCERFHWWKNLITKQMRIVIMWFLFIFLFNFPFFPSHTTSFFQRYSRLTPAFVFTWCSPGGLGEPYRVPRIEPGQVGILSCQCPTSYTISLTYYPILFRHHDFKLLQIMKFQLYNILILHPHPSPKCHGSSRISSTLPPSLENSKD